MSAPILVPVDFESASVRAMEVAKELAAALGSEIVVLHTYDAFPFTYPELPGPLMSEASQAVRRAAEKTLAQFAEKHGVKRARLREGSPVQEILAEMEELKPRMVVMGTHGRKGFNRLVMGSVAERLLRQSTVPVLTVHAPV
jgi:nucleotide-binding universal stress UspA family protein